MTEPDPLTHKAVCVNVTTANAYSDFTVTLTVGDHSFIKHDSVIHYIDAQFLDIGKVQDALDAKPVGYVCAQHEPCKSELLERIQAGLLASKLTKKGVKEYCRRIWQLAESEQGPPK